MFDPLTQTFVQLTPLADRRFRFAAVAAGAAGDLYVFGGQVIPLSLSLSVSLSLSLSLCLCIIMCVCVCVSCNAAPTDEIGERRCAVSPCHRDYRRPPSRTRY